MTKANVHGFISEIENICECSICCNEFDDQEHIPRVLPCQHVFCTNCLSKHCKHQRLKCPLCNQDHYLKNGNINTLPKDYTICNLKELLEKFSRSLCKECKNHTHVQYFCKTCNVQMCQVCYSKRKVALCSKHDIEKLDITFTSQNRPTHAIDTQSSSICFLPGHEKNELKYFCCEKSCCIALCSNCVVESHKEHVYKPITDEYDERKKVMLRFCQVTRDKITNAKIFLDTIRQNHGNVTMLAKKARLNLGKQAIQGIKYIKDFQEKAEKTANEKSQSYLRMLERREEQVKSFIENSTECCAISEEALSAESMIAFLSVEKTLTAKLKSFEKSVVDKPLGPTPPASYFDLQEPTLELEGKIGLMTSNSGGTIKSEHFVKEIMKLFAFLFLTLFLIVCVLLIHYLVPYSRVFDIDETQLVLRERQASQFCISTDRRMFSNIPMEDMKQTCGSTQIPYIFRGAFTNASFAQGNVERVTFSVDVSGIQNYFPGLILFEFGVSKGSIERLNLLGPLSDDFVGWMFTVLNSKKEVALVNTEGRIVHSSVISALDKASYVYYLELKPNNTFLLKTKDKNEKSFKILDETRSVRGKHRLGFAKMCPSLKANVTVKLTRSNITFDRSTLCPNMYIAGNNRTISNIPKTSFKKQNQEKNHKFQDITLLNCKVKCVYVLKLRVDESTNKDVFTLVLTNSKFLPSAHYNVTLMTYTECPDKHNSYCFVVYRNNVRYSFIPMAPDKWQSIIIIVNRKRKSASFMVGTYEINVENGYIFEEDTPILRFVSLSVEDSVKIYLADRDDFHMLTWITCKVCTSVRDNFIIIINIIIVWLIYVIINEFFLDCQRDNKVVTARRIPATNIQRNLFLQHPTPSTTRRRRR